MAFLAVFTNLWQLVDLYDNIYYISRQTYIYTIPVPIDPMSSLRSHPLHHFCAGTVVTAPTKSRGALYT